MKKKLFLALVFAAFASTLFVACHKDSYDGTSVGYAQDEGTGANPTTSTTH